jgi:hypothetical protein
MRALSWTTCLWPGLAGLWWRGRWSGLFGALAFGLLLNFALLRTLAPSELPVVLAGAASPVTAWVLVLGFWVAGVWLGWHQLAPLKPATNPQLEDWFREAQAEYLKGHWIEAETLLAKLLAVRPGDVEGQLLLASVQRRTGRAAAATGTLHELQQNESAGRWAWEIRTELGLIVESSRIAASEETSEKSNTEDNPPLARAA